MLVDMQVGPHLIKTIKESSWLTKSWSNKPDVRVVQTLATKIFTWTRVFHSLKPNSWPTNNSRKNILGLYSLTWHTLCSFLDISHFLIIPFQIHSYSHAGGITGPKPPSLLFCRLPTSSYIIYRARSEAVKDSIGKESYHRR